MATYKVPQDVEAEDKLLGPFTFRQFIYLIIVAVMGFFAFTLWQLLPILAIVPVPVMLLFAVLALPLRKDQPMETYLAAIISFYIKPRIRLWDPDGVESRVEITAPKVAEISLVKNISGDEAERRFAYLAQIVDSKGWATRGVTSIAVAGAEIPNNLNPEMYYEASETVDILDENYQIGQNINQRLEQSLVQHKQEIIDKLVHPAQTEPNTAFLQTEQKPVGNLVLNPYPNIKQANINPGYANEQQPVAPQTSESDHEKEEKKAVSPAIIELATNAPEDFSIATLASQAKRISQEEGGLDGDEVLISLR